MHVLTIDQGTSSLKAALWSGDGRVVAEASVAYRLHRPQPAIAEIDPEHWWAALCEAAAAVLGEGRVAAGDVACVALDGIGWTLVAADAGLTPVLPALTWLDRRAETEAAAMRALPDADMLVDLTANRLDAAYITPKIAWIAGHRPDALERTRWLLTASGWLVARLTGEATCDLTQAYGFHCFDIRGERWDVAAAGTLGIPLELLPPLRRAGEIAGGITRAAAEATGLAEGTPVLVGGLDAATAALGAGVTRPGLTQDQGGSAGGFAISVPDVVVEPRLIFSHHVLDGQYLLQAGTVGGGSLDWLRRATGREGIGFDVLAAEAGTVPAGAGGALFVPYLAGERTPLWSGTARGTFTGLSYSTTGADLVRAAMEGCAFAVLDNLLVAEAHGHRVSEWLGQGGASRSPVWNAIKADVTGRPFTVARLADGSEGGTGLALFALGAAAVGLSGDPADTVDRLLVSRETVEPDAVRHQTYKELHAVWHEVSRALLPAHDRLAAITRTGDTA